MSGGLRALVVGGAGGIGAGGVRAPVAGGHRVAVVDLVPGGDTLRCGVR